MTVMLPAVPTGPVGAPLAPGRSRRRRSAGRASTWTWTVEPVGDVRGASPRAWVW